MLAINSLYKNRNKLIAFCMSASTLISISCASGTGLQQQLLLTPDKVENMLEQELMSLYGEAVRAQYRDDDIQMSDTAFAALEAEVERRELVDLEMLEEIQQGLVYLYMPVSQLYASISGLKEIEAIQYADHNLIFYKGKNGKPNWKIGPFYAPVYIPSIALVCDGQLIGVGVVGVTTFETFFSGGSWRSQIRTNFPPNFFDSGGTEYNKWRNRGWSIPKPEQNKRGAGGWNYPIFLLEKGSLDSMLRKVNYLSMKKYLDKSC